MSCGVGHQHGSDPELLGLWCRPAATALIRPLARKPPYATGEARKRKKESTTQDLVFVISEGTCGGTHDKMFKTCLI